MGNSWLGYGLDSELFCRLPWAGANYTLGIDQDHDTNCTHYTYIGDVKTTAQIYSYLDGYENQGCHLYLMGGHRYRVSDDWAGLTVSHAKNLCMTFMFCGGGLNNNEKTCNELHEPACHDNTVGAIGHCNNNCPCNAFLSENITFCDDCKSELKAAQDLDN